MGPVPGHEVALVTLEDMNHLAALDLQKNAIVWQSDSIMHFIDSAVFSPDGATVYGTGDGRGGGNWKDSQLWALDAGSLHVLWRLAVTDSGGFRRDRFDGLGIHAWEDWMAISPDGRRLFIMPADDGDPNAGTGIAVFDIGSRTVAGFIGPFAGGTGALATVPSGAYRPDGAIAFSPHPSPGLSWKIWLVDPTTLAVTDSADLSAEATGSADGIGVMRSAPDGGALYVRTAAGMFLKYDLLARQVTARVQEPAASRMAISPDGRRIYTPLPWSINGPSPGVIHVYDADLNRLPSIDLSHLSGWSETYPPALDAAAVERDGTLLVSAGANFVELWGTQAGRIFVIDPATDTVEKTIPVPEAPPEIIMLPGLSPVW
jgi:DNA-binding beta-propeller fold protein YncE